MTVDAPRCPDCNGPLENRMFQEGGFMEGRPAEFTHDWFCPACYLRWISVKGEPVEVKPDEA